MKKNVETMKTQQVLQHRLRHYIWKEKFLVQFIVDNIRNHPQSLQLETLKQVFSTIMRTLAGA